MNSRLLGFLLAVSTLVVSLKTQGQATCIAVIDSNRTEFCVGSGAVTFSNARAIGENIEWLSLGDGVFDNRFAENPTYIPGSRDRSSGIAYILLDVYKDDTINYCSALPWVKLYFGSMSATATPASQSICTGTSITSIVLSGVSGGTYNWTRDNTATVTGIAGSGSGNISGTLTNNSGAPLTVTFTITPFNGSCTGTPITATVVVSPRPTAVASVASQSICSGSTITPVTVTGNQSTATYNWTRNNTSSVTGIASSGTGNITGVLTKTSGFSTTTVTFTITPRLSGCAGTAITSTVAVSTSTVAVSGTPSSQTVCSGAPITSIVPSGGSGSTTYSWTRNNTATITGIAVSGSGTISGVLTNTTTAPTYVTFTITRSSSTCTNRASVLVTPAPVAAATPLTQTICSGTAIAGIVLSSNISGTTYTWARNNTASVTGIAASGSGDIAGTLVNTTSSPVTVTFTITPIVNGCAGVPVTATVTISPNLAAAAITPLSQIICSGTSLTTITGNGSGITYNWVRDNLVTVTGISASGTGNIAGVLTTTGNVPATVTFTITPTVNGCSGAAVTATAIVNPRPAAVLSGSQTVCAGLPTLSIALTGATPWNFTYNDGTTAVTVNGNNLTPYTFTVPALAKTYTIISLNDANCTAQAADITGSAIISKLSYAIIASAGTNGFITSAGTTNVDCGANQTYTITPNEGFNISDVLVDGISVGAVLSYTFDNVTESHIINAVFSIAAHTILASAGENGIISPAGEIVVANGANQTFTITANSCYQIADVLVDGVSVGGVSSYTFNNVAASHTIIATFSPLHYAITASAGDNGSITPSGNTSVICGGSVTFAITANDCYQVTDVLLDGVSVGAVSSYTFTNVAAPHNISAIFSALNYAITANAGSNGSITTNGTTNINCGGSLTYSISADAGFNIQDVIVDGVNVGGISSYTFNNVRAAHAISATFSPNTHTISASAGSNGSITTAGEVVVANRTDQTFIISANNCYQIADVFVDGISVGGVSSYTFNDVTASHTINATFSQLHYNVTASAGNNGSITPAGTASVICGGNETYIISADAGFNIQDVLVDGVSVGTVSSYTFNDVKVSHSISATFSAGSFIITASAGSNGSISPSGGVVITNGANQIFTITANSCYQIADVLVDGVSVGAVSSYTFNTVNAAHTISATFAQLNYNIIASTGANGSITSTGSVGCGDSKTFNITANSCYQIADVLINGVSIGAVSSYTFSNVTAPHTISATFSQLSYAITATAGANGSITSTENVGCGDSKIFSITANSCYQVADVLVDGVSVGAVSSYTFSNVTAPHTIIATFSQLSYAITATAGANGSITPAGITNVNCGNSQIYTITAGAGFSIQSVLVDGVSQGVISSYTFSNVTAPHSISASFVATAGCTLRATATAANMACNGSTTTLTVAAFAGTGARQYSIDGVTFQTGNTFTVTPSVAPYIVTVKDAVGCTVTTNSVSVSVAPTTIPATPAGIAGRVAGLCGGGSFTYSVQPVAGATSYVWSAPAGFAVSSGQGSTQVVISVPAGFTGAPGIWAVAKNACGGGTGFRLAVTSTQSYPTASISGPAVVTPAQTGVQYSVPNTAGETYNWLVPTGATVTSGQGTNSITVTFGSANGNVSVAVTNACGTGVRTNKPVSVVSNIVTHIINASSGINGSITPAGGVSITNGADQTFSIAANSCYQIADVLVDGISSGAVSSYTFNNVTTAHTINVTFSSLSYNITASAGSNGSITPTGATAVNCGSSQLYSITANAGFNIQDILVDGISQGAISSYTFSNVTAPHTISATFSEVTYVITASAGSNGSITPAGGHIVTSGGNQTFSITANSCYQVADVLVDGVSVGAVSSYTFSNVTAPHTIIATFSQLSYAITATAGANGSITPAGITNVNCGNSQIYTITAGAGFSIQSVLVDGVSQGVISSYTFSNVTAPHSISASFVATAGCTLRATATAANMACNGSTTTLTVAAFAGTGARQYSIDGVTFQTGNTFTVTPSVAPYIVTVKDAVGCTVTTNSVSVSVAPTTIPATPAGIAGRVAGLCGGGSFTYSVQPVAGATSYVWSAPAGFAVSSGQGSTQVVISVPAGFTGAPGIWAVAKNACGGGTGFRLAVTSTQSYPTASISGPAVVTPAQTGVQYSVPNTAGETYNWLVPTGATVTSGQGTNSITVTFGSANGNVSVAVTNACGTGVRTNKPVSFALIRPTASNMVTAKTSTVAEAAGTTKPYCSIYPNPAYSNATIVFSHPKAGTKFQVVISNSLSYRVFASSGIIMAGQNNLQLDLSKFKSGMYLVRLITEDDTQTIKLVKGQ